MTYDTYGNLSSAKVNGIVQEEYTSDRKHLNKVKYGTNEEEYTYDEQDRVIRITQKKGAEEKGRTTITYSADGKTVEVNTEGGVKYTVAQKGKGGKISQYTSRRNIV